MYKKLLYSLLLCITLHAKQTHDLTLVSSIDPSIIEELWYATNKNFTKTQLYPKGTHAYLRPEVAQALSNAQKEFKTMGYGLKVWDAYRPHSVQFKMWDVVPDSRYVGDPHKGGPHNRGGAVDVTLINRKTGKELIMPTAFDDFSPKAHSTYMKLPKKAIENRTLFHKVMLKHGFKNYTGEWWHFNYKKIKEYPILNVRFEDLENA